MFQDDAIKEIIKRATNVKEAFFDFWPLPSMRLIKMLPESLEHLPYLPLGYWESYSGKFRRLKSLVLMDDGFGFLSIINLVQMQTINSIL